MEIVEVVDRESLKAHLGTLPKMPRLRTALWIASRSATRVSPFTIKFLLGRASEKNAPTTPSLLFAALWLVATNVMAMIPSKDNLWQRAYLLIAVGIPLLGWLTYQNGPWVGLLALAAGMSVLRWPVIYLTRWAKRVVGRYG